MSEHHTILPGTNIDRWKQRQLQPSIFLTVVLALRVFMAPVMPAGQSFIETISQVLVIGALVYMAATTRRHLIIAGVLGAFGIILEFLEVLMPGYESIDWIRVGDFAVLLIYVFWLMIRDLFTAKTVDAVILLLAVNCYLLIGILFSFFYMLVEIYEPGTSFVLAGDLTQPVWNHLYYFSFVTLTTLGYGDIQPVSPIARSLAIAEAVSGVLFTGILVARLVGLYGASTSNKS